MVTVCLQCGDQGAANAFVYCVKCLDFAVHRYCLDTLPETLYEFVHWVCDDCEVLGLENLMTLPSEHREKQLRSSFRHVRRSHRKKSLKRKKTNAAPNPTKALLNNDCQTASECSPLKVKEKVYHTGSHEPFGDGATLKDGKEESTVKCLLSENIEQRLGIIPFDEPCSRAYTTSDVNEWNGSIVPFKSELGKKEASGSPAKLQYHICWRQEPSAALEKGKPMQELSTSVKLNCKKRKFNSSSAELSEQVPKKWPEANGFAPRHPSCDLSVPLCVLAQPIIDPIWRGHFNLLNKDSDAFDGSVAAHMSINACQKVYDEARLFPSSLQLEMHPKADVWPKSFQASGPSDHNIALYFFPNDKRYEAAFDHLVHEMINQELALKAIVKNAELLLFASDELPLNFWMFQQKYYLWGVFRDKKPAAP